MINAQPQNDDVTMSDGDGDETMEDINSSEERRPGHGGRAVPERAIKSSFFGTPAPALYEEHLQELDGQELQRQLQQQELRQQELREGEQQEQELRQQRGSAFEGEHMRQGGAADGGHCTSSQPPSPSPSPSSFVKGLPPYLRYPPRGGTPSEDDTTASTSTTNNPAPSTSSSRDVPMQNADETEKNEMGAERLEFEPVIRQDAAGVRWVQTPHTCAFVRAHLPDNKEWQTRLAARLEAEAQKKKSLRRVVTAPGAAGGACGGGGGGMYQPASSIDDAPSNHPDAKKGVLRKHLSSSSWSSLYDLEDDEVSKRTRAGQMRRKEIRLMHDAGDRIGFSFTLLGRPIMFVRYNCDLYAVGTVCPHMQGDLSRGEVIPDIEDVAAPGSQQSTDDGTRKPKIMLVCPHHNWKFYLSTGQNVGDGKCSDKSISRYVIKVDEVNNEKYFFISGGDIDFLLDQRLKNPEIIQTTPAPSSLLKQKRMLVRRQTHM